MNLKQPIDITAVNDYLRKYQKELIALDKNDANEFLQHLTPYPGITDSVELSRVEGGKISSRYNGVFIGNTNLGKIVPRRLIVRPVVAEMDDEPERYRRAYITEVPGELRKKHPFEGWIIQHGINIASDDLYNAAITSKYNASSEDNKGIETAFDGLGTIFEQEKEESRISFSAGNVFPTGEITRANVGDKLLEMWRSMPNTFRKKKNIKMFISGTISDMYQDWLKDESVVLINDDPKTKKILRGTDGKCELVVINNLPENSQFVLLTTKNNVFYGFDKASDFRSMAPVEAGKPYHFTAAMKYVIGFQIASVHKSELCVNDQPLFPDTKGSVKITIDTAEAITAGAKWRFEGETTWRNSGTTVEKPAGAYSVEFNSATGYTAPEKKMLLVVSDTTMNFNYEYTKSE